MGLDSVELLLAIEDSLAIVIDDDEAARVVTVSDLYDLILSKLASADASLTSAAFYRLRRALIEYRGFSRREIRPSTPLAKLLPWRTRRAAWIAIQDEMQLRLPDLEYPGWIQLIFLALAIAFASAPFAFGWIEMAFAPLIVSLLVVGLGSYVALTRSAVFLATAFPSGHGTVGETALDLLALNHAGLAAQLRIPGAANSAEVWLILTRLLELQLRIPAEQIHPSDRLVADLGID
jgi:hypothetical protein